MRSIILSTLFLIPLIGFASFPIENETTEIINKVSNINLYTKTLWYNTWWAILLNVIVMLIIPQLVIVGIPLLLRLIKGKNRKLILNILGIVSLVIVTLVALVLSDLK